MWSYLWGYPLHTTFLTALLAGHWNHYSFFFASPDWLQMPPLTSNSAFQALLSWQPLLGRLLRRFPACFAGLRVYLSSFSYKLFGGRSPFVRRNPLTHLINSSLTYIPPLKNSLSKDLTGSTNVESRKAHTPSMDQWEKSTESSRQIGLNGVWSHPK